MAQPTRNNPKYVYDIPYFERMELCRILDQNEKWEELGGVYMQFDVLTIQTLRREILRGNSPADELLTKWGHQNHTILELFVLLSKMQHYQAMLTIKQFVDPEYHRLIYEGEQNLSRIFKSKSGNRGKPLVSHLTTNSVKDGLPEMSNLNNVTQAMNKNENSNSRNADKVSFNKQNSDARSNEHKILNNENELHPGRVNAPKSSDAQTVLVNREDAVANEGSNLLLQPRLLKGESAKDKNVSEISSVAESFGILPVIMFKDLELATNGWDRSTILGKGGFGTVYKGTWKNTQVAIKRTKNSDTDENRTAQIQQILGELKMLNSYRHDNILPLYGFSLGGEEPCLIYQYMPNGSLEDRLLCRQGTKPLSWLQRHNIAMGTARGLQFLHTIGEKPLIHGDIKSANILLDLNFEPKIGDFGLAREGPYSHYTHMKVSKVHGTRPYLPDEFLRHKKFSTKVDTHSFGVVLYELATGLRAFDDEREHKFLRDLIDNCDESELMILIDKKCGSDDHQTFPNLIALGKRCTSRKPKDRPEMVMVLQELNAMAVKRDMIIKVQSRMRMSPSNFFEMNQLKISPPPSATAVNRSISPVGYFLPDTNQAVSPAANYHSPINPNPFFPLELDPHPRSISPTPQETVRKSSGQLQQKPSREVWQPPVISISPPTESQSSVVTTDEKSSINTDKTEEDLNYHYSSQLDNFLPLISELGIKTKSEKKDEVEQQEELEVNTSAKGKKLWILDDPS